MSGIGVVSIVGGVPRILIPADKKGLWYSDCSLDPDGRRIAYIVFDHAQFKKEGMYSIWTVNLDGGSPRQITSGGEYGITWSPDGKWILFEKRIEDMNFDLYKIPSDGGEPVAMNIRGQRPEFSPTGARVVYSRTVDWGYEYWLAENVIPSGEGKSR
jgi:Tol biopolymer transport system component